MVWRCRLPAAVLFLLTITAGSAHAAVITQDYHFETPVWSPSPDGRAFEIPTLTGARTIGHAGEPLLPAYPARIILPPGEELVAIRAIGVSDPILSHHLPAPAEAEHALSMEGPYALAEPDAGIYASAALFPADLCELATIQTYRGHRIAYVNLFPVRSAPASGEIHFTATLTLEIETAPSSAARAASQKTYRASPAADRWLHANTDNPAMSARYAELGAPAPTGDRSLVDPTETRLYVIVTNETLAPVYQALANDRTSKGLPAEVVTIEAIYANYTGRDNQERVREFILEAYQGWGIEYVLFGGDINVIPDRDCYCYIIDEGSPMETNDLCCELYFGGLDGTWNDDNDDRWGEEGEEDLIPEVHVGRVCSDNTTEAQNFINKLMLYERQPIVAELESAAFFGEYLWEETWGGMYMEEIRLGSSAWGYTTLGVPLTWDTETYYEMGGGSWSGTDYINAMSGGTHMAHHLGHSNSGFNCKVYTDQIPQFTANGVTHTHNIGYSQGCMAGEFDNADCIHEEFVHAPSGYVAWIGNTRYGFGVHYTTNGSSQYYHRQYVDALFDEEINELAAANSDSRADNVSYIGYEANRWVHYELTAFGDPAMPVWTATPQAPELEHAGVFVLGMGAYAVTVRAGGAPVAGARVCMWDETGAAYDFGVTDANGAVTLDPAPTYPGTMHLVISDANLLVTDETMQIIPEGPFIIVESVTLNDATGGNNDGDCDSGEDITLDVQLYNVWSGPITGVTAMLVGDNPYVAITDDTITYGDFAGGEIKGGLSGDNFAFHIAGDCPDEELLGFTIEIRDDGTGLWTGAVSYAVDAPTLAVVSIDIDDSGTGDGDGCLEPGEAANLTIRVGNSGHTDATGITAVLISGAPGWLVVTQPNAGAGTIPAGGEVDLAPPYSVTLDPGVASPTIFYCPMAVTGDWELDLEIVAGVSVGGFRDDMEAGEGNWTHTIVTPSFVDEWHRSSQRNHTPGGYWSWKCGPIDMGNYANLADGALVTEPIEVNDMISLEFWHWIDAEESGAHLGRAYDGGLVEMSLDGGAWEQITPLEGYSHTIREGSSPGPFPEDTPVFSGAHDWERETFAIEISTRSNVQFRFRFGSDGADTRLGWFIDDVVVQSWASASDAPERPAPAASRLQLSANHPNPFAVGTRFAFQLPRQSEARLRILDAEGRVIRTLLNGELPPGNHAIAWDGRDLGGHPVGAGIYFYRLEAGPETRVRKMTLLR